jgi:hemerythrin
MQRRWSHYLAVGVSSIDDQNIELYNKFNALLTALDSGNVQQELKNVIKFLSDYVVTHLAMEDKVIDRYACPEAFVHKAEHSRFVADIAVFSQRLASAGADKTLAIDVLKRLSDWLQNHVGRTDQDLRQFLRVAMMVRKAA